MNPLAQIVAAAQDAPDETWDVGEILFRDAERFAAASNDLDAVRRLAEGDVHAPALYLNSVLDWGVGGDSDAMRPDGLSEREAPHIGDHDVRVVHGGQQLTWQRPVRLGDRALTAIRRVTRAAHREGRSGELAIIDLRTKVTDSHGPVMAWDETIIALPPTGQSGTFNAVAEPFTAHPVHVTTTFDPIQMLRFSAVTWNTHRIHVDTGFADREGFPGPVVQSSLHGVTLLRAGQMASGNSGPPREFRWRNLAPAYVGETIHASASPAGAGSGADWELVEWTTNGGVTARGFVSFWSDQRTDDHDSFAPNNDTRSHVACNTKGDS